LETGSCLPSLLPLIPLSHQIQKSDFGLGLQTKKKTSSTEVTNNDCNSALHVQSPGYRAPEVLRARETIRTGGSTVSNSSSPSSPIDPAIDLFSLGVILLELYLGRPLWTPNRDEVRSLSSDLCYLRPPSTAIVHSLIHSLPRQDVLEQLESDNNETMWNDIIRNHHKRSTTTTTTTSTSSNEPSLDSFVDLVQRLLEFRNPRSRITAKDAMHHEFVTWTETTPEHGLYNAFDLHHTVTLT